MDPQNNLPNKEVADPKSSAGQKEPKPVTSANRQPVINRNKRLLGYILVSLIFVFVGYAFYAVYSNKITVPQPGKTPTTDNSLKIEKFASDEEFKSYFAEADSFSGGISSGFGASIGAPQRRAVETLDLAPAFGDAGVSLPEAGGGGIPDRVSETNVQVKGIDEPDIVKTDGNNIFFSSGFYGGFRGIPEPLPIRELSFEEDNSLDFAPSPINAPSTKVITAFPPASLSEKSEIDKTGELLLVDNVLVIFSGNKIYGYDHAAKSITPPQLWNFEFDSKQQIVSSRLFDGKIYVVSKTFARNHPCPIPLRTGTRSLVIPCTDVFRPSSNVPVDSTFTISVINPKTGEVEKNTSFVGSSGQSIVYMSQNSIYITYPISSNMLDFIYGFFNTEAKDLIPSDVLTKLRNLKDLDISNRAKLIEFEVILEKYNSSLTDDERLRIENEMENRLETYTQSHMREFEATGIVKIANNGLGIQASGSIPGSPLNQFAIDEYKKNLRVATTVGQSLFGTDSENDVYVLDNNLKISGSVQGLGITERIFSARFIEDKGYLVTFRQIDPFYVLDLSNPNNPEVKGELKIPGFSSYLHPIDKDTIVGVGRENSQVKISLFDVSNPANPIEASKYTLDEFWTEVTNTHHAFLMDSEKGIFFMPGGKGGYIFSYGGNELKLVKAVSTTSAKRAIYINDYLYIIGDTEIVVLNENDWEEVNSLEL